MGAISLRSVENMILVERLNTSKTDLIMQNINKLEPVETKPNSRSHFLYKIGVLNNLGKFMEKYMCYSLFVIKVSAWGLDAQ